MTAQYLVWEKKNSQAEKKKPVTQAPWKPLAKRIDRTN
jgi:hypothetical protein